MDNQLKQPPQASKALWLYYGYDIDGSPLDDSDCNGKEAIAVPLDINKNNEAEAAGNYTFSDFETASKKRNCYSSQLELWNRHHPDRQINT